MKNLLTFVIPRPYGRGIYFRFNATQITSRFLASLGMTKVKRFFLTEITPYLEREQSVVIYQHVSRRGTAEEQVCSKVKQLREELCVHNTMALYYGRGTARVFFVLASRKHSKLLRRKTEKLLGGRWRKHFSLINS